MKKLKNLYKKLDRCCNGQTIVEYAIALALFVLFLAFVMPDLIDRLGTVYENSESTVVSSPMPTHYGDMYTVSYDANGGTDAPDAQIKPKGIDIQLSNGIPIYEGKIFIGWSITKVRADDNQVDYQPGELYTEDRSITLYASWTEETPSEYTLTYHVNPPSGHTAKFADNTETKTATKYHDVAAAIIPDVPLCDRYEFLGWNESPTATAAVYTANDVFIENRDADFYAVWKLKQYTVYYRGNGGTGTLPMPELHYIDDEVTVKSAVLEKLGFQFVGWSEGVAKDLVDYKAGAKFVMPNHDVYLYAVYMPTEFPYNGTTGQDGSVQTFTAPVDGTYKLMVWGAQGGNSTKNGVDNPEGGPKGGYSECTVTLIRGQTIYIAVGGAGESNTFKSTTGPNANNGGWNGGGDGYTDNAADEQGNFSSNQREGSGAGGGATSICDSLIGDGTLENYRGSKGHVLIVAGGGAGANYTGTDGYGGGVSGGNAGYGGTQTDGYAFGKGKDATHPIDLS